ncbi:uncharacterized protein J4E88_007376 [Alternaria novae-zelandiae]|uniref:uncharacterized protein n=1 Tax=Alternaria novae-zelandiae TaxID=430562 RepID=UPI0020C327B8|nr:uncharacterized protein J4E88_007376 [Alternaria novae-zelandiae]KAI4676458.1 hypothetical protein J4E88_007376 [Alternaria novae-zelandiae]
MNGPFIAPSLVFSDMFRMAVVHLIFSIPVNVLDETAEAVMREVTENIDADPVKLRHTVDIIYASAMEDRNWVFVAVKLLNYLCHLIPATLADPNVLPDGNNKLRSGARLVQHYIYTRSLADFQADMQKVVWCQPRMWLLAELADATPSTLLMSLKTNVWILDMMVSAQHLFSNHNIDLFAEYVEFVARGLDENPITEAELTRVLEKVRERTVNADEDLMSKIKVAGLIALRKNAWVM